MKLKDYLSFLCGVQSTEELWCEHVKQMAAFGFDRLIYGHTRFRTETSLGDPEDFVILSNHPNEYLNGFLKEGLYLSAPMLRWALENEGAGSWRIAADMAATIDEDKIQTIQEGLRGLQQGLLDMARDLDGCDAH